MGVVFQLLQFIERNLLVKAVEKYVLAKEIATLLNGPACHGLLGRMSASTREAFLQAALSVAASLEESDLSQAANQQIVDTGLFIRLCELLPRSLRKTIKAMEGNRSSDEIVDPSFLIKSLVPLAGKFSSFNMALVSDLDSTCMAAALRACLKYGMTESSSTSFTEIASQCLRLARALLLSIAAAATNSFPSPAAVYEMIVSHSHFAESLVGSTDDHDSESQKRDLVLLMLTCVSLSKSPLSFGTDVWSVLFRAYGAGLGATDVSLRRLFYVATKRQDVSGYASNIL